MNNYAQPNLICQEGKYSQITRFSLVLAFSKKSVLTRGISERSLTHQSFHKKGKRITANKITIKSRAISKSMVATGMGMFSLKAAFESRINKIN